MILRALQEGQSIPQRAVVVVAHPDDETVGAGGRLASFANAMLIQLTDGAPRDENDARRAGFAGWQDYAAAREREAQAAIACLGSKLRARTCWGFPDQQSVHFFVDFVPDLASVLAGSEIAVTHAYEGGHPDHDTAALAVQLACEILLLNGLPTPLRLEFASYHEAHGEVVTGRFWDDPACPAVEARLSPDCLARKREAAACHKTQADVISRFDLSRECYRIAPFYDFRRPPPPGAALYDRFGWQIDSSGWREDASRLLARARGNLCCSD